MWAAYQNNVPMVRLLLARGADPNQATLYGSPLSQACWNDSVEAAKILIDHGAKVNARDAFADFTPCTGRRGAKLSALTWSSCSWPAAPIRTLQGAIPWRRSRWSRRPAVDRRAARPIGDRQAASRPPAPRSRRGR